MSIVGTYTAQKFPQGYRQLEVSEPLYGEAVTLADAEGGIPAAATRAVIGVEGGDIRFRDDGEDPTSTVGFFVPEGGIIELPSRDAIEGFEVCPADEYGPPILNIHYYSA